VSAAPVPVMLFVVVDKDTEPAYMDDIPDVGVELTGKRHSMMVDSLLVVGKSLLLLVGVQMLGEMLPCPYPM